MTTRTAILLTLLIGLAAATSRAATCAGGSGTGASPWRISAVHDLSVFSNAADSTGWDKHFRMTAGTQAETFSNPPGHVCLVRVHGREAMLQ
jgi:hypothetical protein